MVKIINKKENVLDGITGFVEYWDFSKANSSYEARVNAVTQVASICYQSPKALDSVSLFNRLQAESGGLPSSSYEFVPVLLKLDSEWLKPRCDSLKDLDSLQFHKVLRLQFKNCFKYGEAVADINRDTYLLTNLRALIEDVGEEDSLRYFNTCEEEQKIIKDNFKVFLFNVDLSTRSQMVRHRVNWQELSRRYVSGKKKKFEFYISKKMENVYSFDKGDLVEYSTEEVINQCLDHYDEAIEQGIKPEEARRILPQGMLTQIWGGFQPNQLEGFFKLRLDKHSQKEIRLIAQAMRDLLDENKD